MIVEKLTKKKNIKHMFRVSRPPMTSCARTAPAGQPRHQLAETCFDADEGNPAINCNLGIKLETYVPCFFFIKDMKKSLKSKCIREAAKKCLLLGH